MKIDICSDLHVDAHSDAPEWKILKNPSSDVLIIAGDVSNNLNVTLDVVTDAARNYETVLFVEGNHEHYDLGRTVDQNTIYLDDMLKHVPNVIYFGREPKYVILEETLITGALGWYDWRCYEGKGCSQDDAKAAWQRYSNDSRYPRFAEFGPDVRAKMQADGLVEIVKAAQENDRVKEIVVFTHTSPRGDLMYWHPTSLIWNMVTPSYVNTEMARVIQADERKKIKTWIYGHTHTRKITEIDGVRYINNARGYPDENARWFLIQIEIPQSSNH